MLKTLTLRLTRILSHYWDVIVGSALVLLVFISFLLPTWESPFEIRSIFEIRKINDVVWIGTSNGAFLVKRGIPFHILEGSPVHQIREIAGEVWIGTANGVFRIENGEPIEVLSDFVTYEINEVRGEVWFATSGGAFRISQGRPDQVSDEPVVYDVLEVDDQIWIATPDGVLRIADQGEPSRLFVGMNVWYLREVNGQIFLGTPDGAFRVERGVATPVLKGSVIRTISEIWGEVWIGTSDGAYRIEDDEAIGILQGSRVNQIREIRGEAWVATSEGAFRMDRDSSENFFEAEWSKDQVLEGRSVNEISEVDGEIWLGTDSGLFRYLNQDVSPILGTPSQQVRAAQQVLPFIILIVFGTFTIVRGTQRGLDWMRRQQEQRRFAFEITEAKLQMDSLFPKADAFIRQDVYLAHRRIQATTISGDFYNFLPRADGSIAIYFVDVEGHGLSAALQARSLYQAVTDGEWGMNDARQELERADDLVSKGAIFQKEGRGLCMSFTEIDPDKMIIRHANAGMPFPLLFRHGQSQPDAIQAAGVYVGAGYSRYPAEPRSAEVKVGNGDFLILASDGILEARDDRGRIFGQRGITAAVTRTNPSSPEGIADEIVRAVRRHSQSETPEDDQTLVVAQIGELKVEARLARLKTLEEKDGVFSLLNAGDTGTACHDELRENLKQWASQQGATHRRIKQIWSATWESIQNAYKYGSKPGDVINIRFVPPADDGFLEVRIRQPLVWENWDESLGDRARRAVQTDRVMLGGTVIMLRLASDVRVADLGRMITMRFSDKVVSDWKVIPHSSQMQ